MPPCTLEEYEIKSSFSSKVKNQKTPHKTISLLIEFGSEKHRIMEQYRVYDENAFISDIGGYLGLILGHSMLSIFIAGLEAWEKRSHCKKCRP